MAQANAPMRRQICDTIWHGGNPEAVDPNRSDILTKYVQNHIIENKEYQDLVKKIDGVSEEIAKSTMPFLIRNPKSGKVSITFPLKGRVHSIPLTPELKKAVKGFFANPKDLEEKAKDSSDEDKTPKKRYDQQWEDYKNTPEADVKDETQEDKDPLDFFTNDGADPLDFFPKKGADPLDFFPPENDNDDSEDSSDSAPPPPSTPDPASPPAPPYSASAPAPVSPPPYFAPAPAPASPSAYSTLAPAVPPTIASPAVVTAVAPALFEKIQSDFNVFVGQQHQTLAEEREKIAEKSEKLAKIIQKQQGFVEETFTKFKNEDSRLLVLRKELEGKNDLLTKREVDFQNANTVSMDSLEKERFQVFQMREGFEKEAAQFNEALTAREARLDIFAQQLKTIEEEFNSKETALGNREKYLREAGNESMDSIEKERLELANAKEELQRTNEGLSAKKEELDKSTQELKAKEEELQDQKITTDEEMLQSYEEINMQRKELDERFEQLEKARREIRSSRDQLAGIGDNLGIYFEEKRKTLQEQLEHLAIQQGELTREKQDYNIEKLRKAAAIHGFKMLTERK